MVESLDELIAHLQGESKAPNSRYPKTAVQAFTNPATAEAIQNRLDGGQRVARIRSLGFNPVTALEQLVFEFEGTKGFKIGTTAILVLINQRGYAAGIVDPYDPVPGDRLSGRTAAEVTPFVLTRGGTTDEPLDETDVAASNARAASFVSQLQQRGGMLGGSAGDFADVTGTQCMYSTVRCTGSGAFQRCQCFTDNELDMSDD